MNNNLTKNNFDNGRVAPGSASRPTVVGDAAFDECRVNDDAAMISSRVSEQ
jgi:hypothetical protein